MITIEVTQAKRRFGRTPRNQWQWLIVASNGLKFSEKDTYANTGDIAGLWRKIVAGPEAVQIRVHYASGRGETTVLRAAVRGE